MRRILVFAAASLAVAFVFCSTSVTGASNFVRVSLPQGVSLEIPKNWTIYSGNERMLVDTWLEAKGFAQVDSKAGFIAEFYNDNNQRLGALHLRYFPNAPYTQAQVRAFSANDIAALDRVTRKSSENASHAMNTKILSWEAARIKTINGITALVMGYSRFTPTFGEGAFRVRLVRVYAGPRSYTLTISYLENSALLMTPITDYIIASLRQD